VAAAEPGRGSVSLSATHEPVAVSVNIHTLTNSMLTFLTIGARGADQTAVASSVLGAGVLSTAPVAADSRAWCGRRWFRRPGGPEESPPATRPEFECLLIMRHEPAAHSTVPDLVGNFGAALPGFALAAPPEV
jgi:hypothetical protein